MDTQPVDPRELVAAQVANQLLYNLATLSYRTNDKYLYYNADHDVRDFGISTPLRMRNTRPGIGWAGRAVNTLSDRVEFDGFANDKFGINDYLDSINASSVIAKSKHDGFIAGCSFVMVADNDNDDAPADKPKVLIPFTALEATGIVDQTSGLLRVGLAVTRWNKLRNGITWRNWTGMSPRDYLVFTPDFTAVFKDRVLIDIIDNPTGRCLLLPLTHRASADRPLGKSRITNTVRRIIQEVGRLKRREEIAEEFYSLPQRYISGLAEGAEKDTALDSAIGKVWTITKDDEGDAPTVGQLTQMSINQFETAKKDKARDFCAETALTLRNLGYETSNPTSAESLSAMSDDLLLEAQKCQEEMGRQIKQIAITLRMATDGTNTIPDGLDTIIPSWKPIFQVDPGPAGDALFKLLTVMPELAGSTASYQMLGIGIREAERLQAKRLASSGGSFMQNGGGN
jgi:hypothetical protein